MYTFLAGYVEVNFDTSPHELNLLYKASCTEMPLSRLAEEGWERTFTSFGARIRRAKGWCKGWEASFRRIFTAR